jgi:hypothetical protein
MPPTFQRNIGPGSPGLGLVAFLSLLGSAGVAPQAAPPAPATTAPAPTAPTPTVIPPPPAAPLPEAASRRHLRYAERGAAL